MNGSSVVSMLLANIENKATGNRTATQTIDVFKVNCERNLHNHGDLSSPQASNYQLLLLVQSDTKTQ